MAENELTGLIIGCGISVHQNLGPGLLEKKVYHECLLIELENLGLDVQDQKFLPIIYKGRKLGLSYKIDLLVENKIVIEVKSVDFIRDIYVAQTLTYMRLGNYRLGLVMNFNSILLKDGIKRLTNGY